MIPTEAGVMDERTPPLQAIIVAPEQGLPIKPFGLNMNVLFATEATGNAISVIIPWHVSTYCKRHGFYEDVFDRGIDMQILRLRRKRETDPSPARAWRWLCLYPTGRATLTNL